MSIQARYFHPNLPADAPRRSVGIAAGDPDAVYLGRFRPDEADGSVHLKTLFLDVARTIERNKKRPEKGFAGWVNRMEVTLYCLNSVVRELMMGGAAFPLKKVSSEVFFTRPQAEAWARLSEACRSDEVLGRKVTDLKIYDVAEGQKGVAELRSVNASLQVVVKSEADKRAVETRLEALDWVRREKGNDAHLLTDTNVGIDVVIEG